MKTTYNVCSTRYAGSGPDGQEPVIKSFRHQRDAEAFMADRKNIRRFGEMRLVEQVRRVPQVEPEEGEAHEPDCV